MSTIANFAFIAILYLGHFITLVPVDAVAYQSDVQQELLLLCDPAQLDCGSGRSYPDSVERYVEYSGADYATRWDAYTCSDYFRHYTVDGAIYTY